MFYTVALLSPPFSTLTYTLPQWWPSALAHALTPGMRVAIPLGKGLRVGIILSSQEKSDLPPEVTVKAMASPLEMQSLLDPEYLTLMRQLALRQGRSEGHILGQILPAGLRMTKVKIRSFAHEHDKGKAKIFGISGLADLDQKQGHALAQQLVQGSAHILPPTSDSAATENCVLQVDPPWPVRPMALKQVAILDHLHDHGSTTRRQLLRIIGTGTAPALAALVKQGHVQIQAMEQSQVEADNMALLPPPEAPFSLCAAQEEAVSTFEKALHTAQSTGQAQSHLLYGITGSGKTAVYMELAKKCYERGLSCILLAPEVALALKLRRDVARALPDKALFLYHGYQTPASREKLFREMAARKEPCIVVGTRSALFLPLQKVGAIVLDEEHDSSFKQDEKLPYQAKEVAWFRMAQHKGLLVLGSATPDLKTFYAAKQGKLPMQSLPSRVGGGTLPEISLVNISGQKGSQATLAPESEWALKETLDRGEQAVILLNRRGYAPLMYCLDCNEVARCPHCEIGLTYHKGRERLICHYCGYAVPFPALCTHCKGMHFLPMGEGTEKLSEHLATLTTGKVLRLDKDSTRREGRMEEILEAFRREEAQILVGTQMLSKGHHFPQVTLALVADGDLGLNTPDYRAAERTFQLLVQSAGRAGRGEKPGKVLIQTRDVNHYCWKYIQNADFEGFYTEEMTRREKRRYPPFVHLALIRMSFGLDFSEGPAHILRMGAELRRLGHEMGLNVLGPAPAPLAFLRGQKRFHCLIKGHNWQNMRQLYTKALELSDKKHMKLSLDLDPLNMY